MIYWAKMRRLAMAAAMQLNVFVSHSDNEDADYIVSDHDTNSECSETEELLFFFSFLFLCSFELLYYP
ncbi:unnamed protein product [Parnassius apollo]|uniref:(apollo) hypothetical protein n=1 Tax=Parnassius apollo TaxID=110799 RepID=A0A8S3WZH9_PARAO|nr:unnamed protein product [Parnassius apollo]